MATGTIEVEGYYASSLQGIPVLYGICFEHSHRPDADGKSIRTSPVKKLHQEGDGWVAETLNSHYRLVVKNEIIDSLRNCFPSIFS